jgi:hypothetical protein
MSAAIHWPNGNFYAKMTPVRQEAVLKDWFSLKNWPDWHYC